MTRFDLKIAIRLALLSLGQDPKRPFPQRDTVANLKLTLLALRRQQRDRGIIPTQVERIDR